jgi:hypothetical protein
MPYRPQFDFCDTPEGYYDVDFEYVFTPQSTPQLGVTLAPGETSLNIPLQLQTDAPEYLIRQIQIGTPQAALSVQFRDAFDNFLSDDFVPSWCFASSAGNNGAIQEPEIPCPRGAVILINLLNAS